MVVITHPRHNLNGAVEVKAQMSSYTPLFYISMGLCKKNVTPVS